MVFIGVDPGFTGAIAFLEDVEGDEYARVFDMPVRQQGTKKRIDRTAVIELVKRETEGGRIAAVVEAISAMGGKRTKAGLARKEGTVSMVNFGRGQGEVLGILEALGALVFEIPPPTWKMKLGLVHMNEQEVCERAALRFPGQTLFGPRGGALHDRAEALFMAAYARMLVTGRMVSF